MVADGFSRRKDDEKMVRLRSIGATTILDKIAKIRVVTQPRKLRQCRSHVIKGTSTKQGMGKW